VYAEANAKQIKTGSTVEADVQLISFTLLDNSAVCSCVGLLAVLTHCLLAQKLEVKEVNNYHNVSCSLKMHQAEIRH